MLGLMPQREDGACIHLAEDNTCKIYDTRPELCRVDAMYEKRKENLKYTKQECYEWNNFHCNNMILEDGLDKKYLIDIRKYGTNSA